MEALKKTLYLFVLSIMMCYAHAEVVSYEFDITEKEVAFSGESATALAIGGQIPAPTIEATVGDTLQVAFHNKMKEETSIHWHGVLLPNDQDGVPYLTTPPIKPNSSFTYRFRVKHAGTYWYHSHTGLQEQRGLYGALIFHPPGGEKVKTDKDYVVVFSDWTDEHPQEVFANIKRDGEYYMIKKDSVQSWDKILEHGSKAIKNRIDGALSRMGPMDISDIGYDAFLANGKREGFLSAKPGETVRLRLINAGSATYFNVEFAGGDMQIVSADGVDVESTSVKRLLIAIAETYDVIVKIPDNRSYELRATAEDGTGYSSTFVGAEAFTSSEAFTSKVFAPDIPRPNLFLREHKHHHKKHGMKHDHHMHHHMHHKKTIPYMDNYKALRAAKDTSLPASNPERVVTINLTGNMERFVWSFDNKTLLESNTIMIKKGENVRFRLVNKTMMHHPIHLHGHFFRVLNGQGERSPLKHTVNVPSMSEVEIEFEANEEKDWFFHCHNLYHMKAGMSRFISYEKTTQATPEIAEKISKDTWFYSFDLSGLYNMVMGMVRASNTRNAFEFEYDYNYKKEYDIDIMYERSFTRFFHAYGGLNIEREHHEDVEVNGILGVKYMFPFLVEFDFRIDMKGNLRLGIESDLQLTKRCMFEWSANTDAEYRFVLSYEVNKNLLVTAAYDSDFKEGVGVRCRF